MPMAGMAKVRVTSQKCAKDAIHADAEANIAVLAAVAPNTTTKTDIVIRIRNGKRRTTHE